MRTALICHAEDMFDRRGLAAWLASFTTLTAIVVLTETRQQKRKRYIRELRRVGPVGFADVIAMRIYQRLRHARQERALVQATVSGLEQRYGPPPAVPELHASTANDPDVVSFLKKAKPDIVLARCKQLLSKKVFSIPRHGTYVMHPGICPEYRNAHGCFWALVERDLDRVGMTLLRIDPGIDTGPVFGYYTYPYDEKNESYDTIQRRVVSENLDALSARFREINSGVAEPIDTKGRNSGVWGQPRLSRYLEWRRAARNEG